MDDRSRDPRAAPSPAGGLGGRIAARVRRRRGLARAALTWENLWRAVWPAACVAGLFLALAGLDVLPVLPAWLHAALLAAFALWLALALWRGARHFRLPDSEAAERRLELDSGVDHRPLVTLGDRLASGAGDAASEHLWQVHLQRALATARRLRVRPPRPGLAGRDPRAFRFAVLLALVVATAAAHEDPQDRLVRALTPDLAGTAGIPAASLEIWVTPPQYTGLPPRLLTNVPTAAGTDTDADAAAPGATPGENADSAAAPVAVPAGSQILAQINDGRGEPTLTFGGDEMAFRAVAERAWRIEFVAETEGAALRQTRLGVSQGGTELADWPLVITADRAPIVEFASPPETSRRNALKLEYRALDDFGITGVVARLTRPAAEATPRDSAVELPLPLTGRNMRDGGTATFHDLTAHRWAGLDVEIALEARDAIDQVGRSDRLTLTLPERTFDHPVAREVIEQRKLLTLAPDDRVSVAEALAAIASRPGRYAEDLVVFMALMTARSRLAHDRTEEAVVTVQDLLWSTALRLEDGALSLAESDIRELQRRLQDALARDASDEEIRKLTEDLRKALDRLFEALAEQLQKMLERGELPEMDPLDPNVQAFDRNDLERMLDQIEQLAQTGAREAAQQLLSQMQQMLENLRNGQFAQQRPNGGSQQAQQMMRELGDMLRRQQELQDRSFSQNQRGERSGEGDTADQEALRRQLGELMRKLGEMSGNIPGEFGEAEQAMRRAGEALGQGMPGDAIGPQGEALDLLRQGAQGAMQAMRGGNGPGEQNGFENFGRPNQNRDPLGRPLPGTFGAENTGDVGIPDAGDLQRAREILRELRSRAGDRLRPPPELDYLERLLKRF
jgi:uncharacterized protein (TIGR02302 family)